MQCRTLLEEPGLVEKLKVHYAIVIIETISE